MKMSFFEIDIGVELSSAIVLDFDSDFDFDLDIPDYEITILKR